VFIRRPSISASVSTEARAAVHTSVGEKFSTAVSRRRPGHVKGLALSPYRCYFSKELSFRHFSSKICLRLHLTCVNVAIVNHLNNSVNVLYTVYKSLIKELRRSIIWSLPYITVTSILQDNYHLFQSNAINIQSFIVNLIQFYIKQYIYTNIFFRLFYIVLHYKDGFNNL